MENQERLRRRYEAEQDAVLDCQFALLDLMAEAGINKAELAKRLGVSRSSVSQMFAADANPTVRQLARVYDALDAKCSIAPTKSREWQTTTVSVKKVLRTESGSRLWHGKFVAHAISRALNASWAEANDAANENYAEAREAA